MIAKIKAVCSDYRELVFVILAITLLAWAAHRVPLIDPRVSFDGWSDLLYTATRIAQGFAVVFCAWASKIATHGELSDEEDAELRSGIRSGEWAAVRLYALDMFSVAFWVLLWSWIVFGGH